METQVATPAEAPPFKRCKVNSQDLGEGLLHVDETRLMEGMVPDVYQSREGNILFEISEVKRTVALSPQSSSWPDSLQHVVQGAICVHRLRLLDISRREEVFFLELFEGSSRHVRAHNGQCFFLSEHGHWAVYNGVIPQGVLARCKKFLLFLEGLYRLLPANTLRVPDAIINAVAALLRCRNGSADLLLQDCERAAICGGPASSKRRRANAVAQEDVSEEEKDKPWTEVMASTVGKLYVKLCLGCRFSRS